jgi:hypothetical protein
MRDVMLSQLNYRAAAWLNDGAASRRYAGGAHSHYVPAQLSAATGGTYLALFITHDRFWRAFAAEAGIEGFSTMAGRSARREEVLAVVAKALATDTAGNWQARLGPLGVPAEVVRSLPGPSPARTGHCARRGTSGSSGMPSGSRATSRRMARRRGWASTVTWLARSLVDVPFLGRVVADALRPSAEPTTIAVGGVAIDAKDAVKALALDGARLLSAPVGDDFTRSVDLARHRVAGRHVRGGGGDLGRARGPLAGARHRGHNRSLG